MKVSYNWLKEILQFDLSPQQVAEALTGAGFPVEELLPGRDPGGWWWRNSWKCAPIQCRSPLLTKVSDGVDTYSVVCGAKNIAPATGCLWPRSAQSCREFQD